MLSLFMLSTVLTSVIGGIGSTLGPLSSEVPVTSELKVINSSYNIMHDTLAHWDIVQMRDFFKSGSVDYLRRSIPFTCFRALLLIVCDDIATVQTHYNIILIPLILLVRGLNVNDIFCPTRPCFK